jgi:hypothetical protein
VACARAEWLVSGVGVDFSQILVASQAHARQFGLQAILSAWHQLKNQSGLRSLHIM